MGNNASVKRFRSDMLDLQNQMKQSMRATLLKMGDELVGNIRDAIPHSVSGELKASVRKQDVSSSDGARLSVLVRAGGPLTTRRASTGKSYDYALAEEFGTTKETPRPFFFNTVRLYSAQGKEECRETFEQTIAENNRLRAAKAQDANIANSLNNEFSSGYVARGGKSTRTIEG